MARTVRLNELLVGIEGLALLRTLYDGTDEDAAARLTEVRRILADDALASGEETSEAGARDGYRAWSVVYDEPGNPLIDLEQPVVWSMVDHLPPGRVLDAACGTGRHAGFLAGLGHTVTGVDLSPDMLAVARANVPGASFLEGDLVALPVDDAAFDLVVCGLALAHVADLAAAVRELSRALAPGGELVVSALHPFQALLGWHAPFRDGSGRRHFVREHPHTHADYFSALAAAGLHLVDCVEPAMGEDQVQAKQRAFGELPEATRAAYLDLPAVLVLHAVRN
jgi:ubiquinone/menaquinone biosynthesis C-methylase UbiE